MRRLAAFLTAIYCFAEDGREYRAFQRQGVVESEIPFLAVGATWKNGADPRVMLRVSPDGRRWSRWTRLQAGPDTCSELPRASSSLAFFDWNQRYIEYQAAEGIEDLRFFAIDPGQTPERRLSKTRVAVPRETSIDRPAYVSRVEWGSPDGANARGPLSYAPVTHLIVHHSADGFTGTDYPAWVRAIWRFHVMSNGWVDFGYNWAIDPNGTLYEGRAGGDNVIGAHFSCQNSGTMGVVMLGTFTNALPTAAAMDTLSRLLAWKAGQREIDPLGRSLHRGMGATIDNISGHRDGNRLPGSCTVTECPGDRLYPALPQVRQAVAARIANASRGLFLSESFDAVLPPGWTAEGLWRWWDGMAWFGDPETKTYESARNGSLTSPEFTVDADAVLRFRSWHDTEDDRPTQYDQKFVEISVDGGDWQTIDQLIDRPREWTSRAYPLSVRGKVRVRFRFETVDEFDNAHEGWYVDDVAIEAAAR